MAGASARLAASTTWLNGLLARPLTSNSFSASESGTRVAEVVDFVRGRREVGVVLLGFERRPAPAAVLILEGGGANLFLRLMDCVSFSYSTDVLLGGLVEVEEAQEPLAVVSGTVCMSMMSGMAEAAAWWKAVATLTDVSLTDHLSGFGGVLMIPGAPGREVREIAVACSRCFRRA